MNQNRKNHPFLRRALTAVLTLLMLVNVCFPAMQAHATEDVPEAAYQLSVNIQELKTKVDGLDITSETYAQDAQTVQDTLNQLNEQVNNLVPYGNGITEDDKTQMLTTLAEVATVIYNKALSYVAYQNQQVNPASDPVDDTDEPELDEETPSNPTTTPTETTAPADNTSNVGGNDSEKDETTAPSETTVPAESTAPSETTTPTETTAPSETTTPTETTPSVDNTSNVGDNSGNIPEETTVQTEPPVVQERTITAEANGMQFTVSGVLNENVTVEAVQLEADAIPYINGILGLDESTVGTAYDITLYQNGEEIQPDSEVTVTINGVDAASSVYHLPETSANDVYEAMMATNGAATFRLRRPTEPKVITGESIVFEHMDRVLKFKTHGFSTYYIVAGSQSERLGNHTFNILRGTSVQLSNVISDDYVVTYPNGVSADNSGVTITRNNSTLTFAATSSAAYGTYSVEIPSSRTATIIIRPAKEMFELEGIENDVYFTVVSNSTEIPNEPMSGGNYSWNYIKKNGSVYTFTPSAWGPNGLFQQTPNEFINLDAVANSAALKQNLQGQNVIGVIDRGLGRDTRPCINLTDDEWHNILKQFVSSKAVYISDGSGGQVRLNSDMVEERLDDGSYRYRMYPYVVKLIIDGGSYQDGWHVDCAIADTKTYYVSYEYNLPDTAVIQENSDLYKPETKFYVPGTTGVEVGVLTLGNQKVTGDTSITIYDTNTLATSEYKFLYWNTKPDGSGTRYDPNDKLPAINDNVTLYAIWNHTQTSGTFKLTKQAVFEDSNDTRADDAAEYVFTVTIANATEDVTYPYRKYDASDKLISEENATIASGGTVTLKNGEYIIINNMPAGNVTVTETKSEDAQFTVSWNGATPGDNENEAVATVSAGNQTAVVCTNTYVPLTTTITLTKKVDGNMASHSEKFTFVVTVDGVQQESKIELSHNNSATIEVPIGAEVTIVEQQVAGYTATATLDGNVAKLSDNTLTIEKVGEKGHAVVFTNTNEATIETGITSHSFPFILLLSTAIVFAMILLLDKARYGKKF